MADTVLVVADIAADLIDAGRALIAKLDAKAVRVDASFWLMDPENGNWRLYLGVPSARETGVSPYYDKVDEVLAEMGFGVRFWIGMVTIENSHSKIMLALATAFGNEASVDGMRLHNETIGGIRISACVLYRVSAEQTVGTGHRVASPRRRKSPKATHATAA